MKITILGSGTYIPRLDIANSSYLIQVNNQNILLDFGRGTINQLLKAGVQYYDIDKIFITHAHADHCCDLSSFLHISLAEPQNRKLRKKDVTIYGPKGIKDTIRHLIEAFHLENKEPEFKVHIKELNIGDKVEEDSLIIKSFEADHSDKIVCFCYRIEADGKILAYSGDSLDTKGLRDCCKDADIAILEATNKDQLKGHLTGEIAGKVASYSNVKKLILTHIGIEYLKKFNPKKDAQKFFKGEVIVAKDMMVFELVGV